MNTPVPLYTLSDQRKPAAYKCPVCTMIWSHNGDDYASTQAAKCCSTTCDVCGGPKPIRGYCQACQNRREAEHTAKLYADAEKITPAEWDGPVYNPFTDRYSASVGEALEAADEDDSPAPYLWPCDSDTAQIDPDRVVEEITEDMHEDYEVDDYAGLVAFCKEWNAKQTGATWSMNTVRVIVIEGDE